MIERLGDLFILALALLHVLLFLAMLLGLPWLLRDLIRAGIQWLRRS